VEKWKKWNIGIMEGWNEGVVEYWIRLRADG
jgi:hypothetical protein